MPDTGRTPDLSDLTPGELERTDPGAPMLSWFADAANARLNVSGAGAGQR